MPIGKMKENSGTTGNIPIYTINATNMVTGPANSNGLVIIKLKYKLKYHGHVFFESVSSVSLQSILNYLKTNNHFYQDVVISTENVSLDLPPCT